MVRYRIARTRQKTALTSTKLLSQARKVNHLILKPDTRSAKIELQRVQSNVVRRLIPVVSIVEKLVDARDKIRNDAFDAPELIRAATDAIALIGAANFELNAWSKDMKPEFNETTNICALARSHSQNSYLAMTLTCFYS